METKAVKKPEVKGVATNGAAKPKTPNVKRSEAELKSTTKGKLIMIIRNAVILAGKQEDNKLGAVMGEKNTSSVLSQRMFSVTKKGGKIELMDEKSQSFSRLGKACVASLAELKVSNYGDNTVKLITLVLDEVCGGAKGFNPGSLLDISLDEFNTI